VRALLDVNLLIALFQPRHVHHQRAQEWWARNRIDGWATCPLTQNGFVRIVSQRLYEKQMPIAAVLEILAGQLAATDHVFWPDDISIVDPALFHGARILGPKQLTDIYLLALAVQNGGRFATLDQAISLAAVRGAEPRHLVVV
jgi:uncharacterized protein